MKPGDFVRTREALTGIARGPSSEHGDGRACEIPRGALCEVYEVQELLGWVTVHFDLEDSGPREPFFCEAVTTEDRLEPAKRPGPPPIMMPEPPPDL